MERPYGEGFLELDDAGGAVDVEVVAVLRLAGLQGVGDARVLAEVHVGRRDAHHRPVHLQVLGHRLFVRDLRPDNDIDHLGLFNGRL